MTDYISPVLGLIEYYKVVNRLPSEYYDRMKGLFGFGVLRSGVLWCETEFDEVSREFVGLDLNNYLLSKGFSTSESIDLVKIFSVNQSLIDDLVEQGFDVYDVVYGMSLKDRLASLNLTSRTFTKSYVFESIFKVYPIIEAPREIIHEELISELPEFIYRSQATFTYSSRKQGTKVELRIWYQDYEPIKEQDLIDKWNSANENSVNLTNEPLLDSMEPNPGFEHNHEVMVSELEGSIGLWYGKLIISRAGKNYVYDVL